MNRNKVVLVDEDDNAIVEMDKLAAHELGLLHRAFSIFVFNDNNELLLQQRAVEKYHGGGLWTNTCCSHPQMGEDLNLAALERLEFEMGFACDLEFSHSFIYKANVENNLIEYELDHVFVGYFNGIPNINTDEVKSFKWISLSELFSDIALNPDTYTFWFKEALPLVCDRLK